MPGAPDYVAAGRRNDRLTAAREQRAGKQNRRADAAAELLVELALRDVGGVDPHLAAAHLLDVDAEVRDELEHRLDVGDRRDVRQRHRLVSEEHGRDDREGGVLVARSTDRPVQRAVRLR